MKVHIEGNLYLESDERQYILVEYSIAKSGKNEGEPVGRNLSYHPTIESAIRSFANRKIKESTAQTLSEFTQELRKINEYIRGLFAELTAIRP